MQLRPKRCDVEKELGRETRTDLVSFARELRRDNTDAEALMWGMLRDRRMNGRKFRREHPCEPYVLDFFCRELGLVVELDGGQHNSADGRKTDRVRTAFLEKLGYRVLRFTNREVLTETTPVLDVIWRATRRDGEENEP